jgi:hypothetical protein
MAMRRREREELAVDQVVPLGRARVPGEAAAAANERAQRQQLALDLDRAVTEPVPEVLRALREPEPLWAVEHRIGMDEEGREASSAPANAWSTFRARRSSTGPSGWTSSSRRSPTTEPRRRDERTSSLALSVRQRAGDDHLQAQHQQLAGPKQQSAIAGVGRPGRRPADLRRLRPAAFLSAQRAGRDCGLPVRRLHVDVEMVLLARK